MKFSRACREFSNDCRKNLLVWLMMCNYRRLRFASYLERKVMLSETLTLLLAGGVGSRLNPLTADRAKPAVPFGGKYRIIDFTLSNCLHSGLRRVLVLTQYKSHSLQKHLRDGWSIFNPECGEYVTPVPPQMRTGNTWYTGTADAIFQNLYLVERSGAKYVLILSGDHIYRMDYAAMLDFHRDTNAELTVSCMKVPIQEASAFGVMSIDPQSRITRFHEKPKTPESVPGEPHTALASMGIYVFNAELLCQMLRDDHEQPESLHDFGKDIIPSMIGTQRVFAYEFGGPRGRVSQDRYWRDVGTIDAYYEANMDLLQPIPPVDLYQNNWPIRTYQAQQPPARVVIGKSGKDGAISNSLLAGGTVIAGGTVQHSILSKGVRVEDTSVVSESILFDDVVVGDGSQLRRCIIDKSVRIPPGTRIGFDLDADRDRFTVSDGGIVVVPRLYRFE